MQAVDLDSYRCKKVATLLSFAGPNAIQVFNTLTFTAGEEYTTDGKPKYDAVIQKFELYCNPKNNETYARYLFRTRLQEEHETFDHFVVDLKNQSKKCNFICTKCQDTTFRDSMIKDQIVIGVNHENLQE